MGKIELNNQLFNLIVSTSEIKKKKIVKCQLNQPLMIRPNQQLGFEDGHVIYV